MIVTFFRRGLDWKAILVLVILLTVAIIVPLFDRRSQR